MTAPDGPEPLVVPVAVPTMPGVIPLLEVVRGLERAAAERGPALAEGAVVDPFEQVRRLAGQLAAELERLPDIDLAGGAR